MAIPKSVKEFSKFPHWARFYDFGTRFHEVITLCRDLFDEFATGGSMFSLVNELRTRLHTGGDYQALISAIRADLIANGETSNILIDLCDKAFNQCLVQPGWQQNTGAGGNVDFESTAAINCVVDGIYYANHFVATQDLNIDAGTTTAAGEYRAVTLSLDNLGALHQTVSAVSASAPAPIPRPPSGECAVGVIQIPASFSPGVTAIQTAWFTQGFPRRLDVYTPLTTADVAAISASALTTKASTLKPDALPDTLP